ncbi:MAG: hypothetical protein ABIG46_02105 [Candidatus Omnitrophota bacterium]
MKLSKFLLLAFIVTSAALFYVWQQTEIFRLGYVNQKNVVDFQKLLDANSILRYNLKSETSLIQMGEALSGSQEFHMPDSYILVKVQAPVVNSKGSESFIAKNINLFARLFSVKRQVEAKTIGP